MVEESIREGCKRRVSVQVQRLQERLGLERAWFDGLDRVRSEIPATRISHQEAGENRCPTDKKVSWLRVDKAFVGIDVR